MTSNTVAEQLLRRHHPGHLRRIPPVRGRSAELRAALGGADYPKLIWLMDNRLETNSVIISTPPMQDTDDLFNCPGRYGAHKSTKTAPAPCSCAPTPWCTPPSSTAASAPSAPPTPSNPKSSLLHPPYPRRRPSQRHQRRPRGRKRDYVRGGPTAGRAVYFGGETVRAVITLRWRCPTPAFCRGYSGGSGYDGIKRQRQVVKYGSVRD